MTLLVERKELKQKKARWMYPLHNAEGIFLGENNEIKEALLKMLGWRILQGFQSLFHFLKKRCFHRLLREYPTDSLL